MSGNKMSAILICRWMVKRWTFPGHVAAIAADFSPARSSCHISAPRRDGSVEVHRCQEFGCPRQGSLIANVLDGDNSGTARTC